VGLSSIDGSDASQNSTTQYRKFERNRWYTFRLQVTPDKLSGWIDGEAVIEADIRGKKIALRPGEIEQSVPFGFATWNTKAELRNIRLRSLGAGGPSIPSVAEASPTAGCEALIQAAKNDTARIHGRLAELCDRFGHRLAGSRSHEAALSWIVDEMKRDGLENVHSEAVSIPRWVRGPERCDLVRLGDNVVNEALPILGLGGTVGTPPEGLTAQVLVVTNFTELTNRATEAKGRIVVFDAPFTEYGDTVRYRYSGAVSAASVGAVASLVRAVGPFSLRTPHTGMMSYDGAVNKIPHASLSPEDTARLRRWQERGVIPTLRLQLDAHLEGETPSRNLVAEWKGREHPEEIIVVGGHSDSWDVGQGAQDDGGGVISAWEAVHLMKRLNLRPRRTLRIVLWTHEESGGRGARAYRDQHRAELPKHVFAMESDSGTFAPKGFAFTGSDAGFALLQPLGRILAERLGAGTILRGGAEADIAPLLTEGVPVGGPRTANEKYFWFHHTDADTVDKVDPKDLADCTGLMAAVCYWIAESNERLPR
jgi:carboxypeptidase Q